MPKQKALSKEHKEKLALGRARYQAERQKEKEAAKKAAEAEYQRADRPKGSVFRRRRPVSEQSEGTQETAEVLPFPPGKSIEVVAEAAIAQLDAAEKLLAASRALLESLQANEEAQKAVSG